MNKLKSVKTKIKNVEIKARAYGKAVEKIEIDFTFLMDPIYGLVPEIYVSTIKNSFTTTE